MSNNIKAILFDSGKVLNRSRTGHWFIPPKFFEYADKKIFESINEKKIKTAFRKANGYINSQKFIKSVDIEYKKFIEFYEIFAEEVTELNLSNEDIRNIAKDLVYNPKKYEFYDDALPVVEELKRKYTLGIVSDAWPSLKNVFKDAGLYEYFDTFIISSMLGVTKPDKKMFNSALEELDVKPQNAVFVDDNLKNCKGAAQLGMYSFWLCRNERKYKLAKVITFNKKIEPIKSLCQIKNSKVFR